MGIRPMIAGCLDTRGGWFFESSLFKGTGVAVGTVISLLTYPVEANTGTAGVNPVECHQSYISLSPTLRVLPQEKSYISATTADNLIKIRNVFKPAVSDLANTFGVSRQAIYNWLAGEEPVEVHAKKIMDLASAADLAMESGFVFTAHVLKRKIENGKSLFELIQSGESAVACMMSFLQKLNREAEQRNQIKQRLAKRHQPSIDSSDIGSLVINEIG